MVVVVIQLTGRPCHRVVVHKPAPQPTYIQPKPVYIPPAFLAYFSRRYLSTRSANIKINLEQTTLKIKPEPTCTCWTPPKSTPAPVWTPPKPMPPVKKIRLHQHLKNKSLQKRKIYITLISYDDNSYQQYQAEKTKRTEKVD